jgi:hypothetical protein
MQFLNKRFFSRHFVVEMFGFRMLKTGKKGNQPYANCVRCCLIDSFPFADAFDPTTTDTN